MVWMEFTDIGVKQYSTSRMPNGAKRISSGKLEHDGLKPLVGKPVLVEVKVGSREIHFLDIVKENKVGKYTFAYVSDKLLKEFVGTNVDADVIEIEARKTSGSHQNEEG